MWIYKRSDLVGVSLQWVRYRYFFHYLLRFHLRKGMVRLK